MKKQKTLNRLAAVAAVLLTLCLVFMMPVGAATTLPAAVDGVITLTEDVQLVETWTIEEGQTFVLNLNRKTITSSVTAIKNSGTLTINGPGTIDVSGATAEATRVVMNCGDLTLNGGTYKGTEALYSYAINNNPGTLEANNAEVIGGFGGIGISSGSNAEINGGTYTLTGTEGGHLIYIKDSSKLVINDGTFKGDKETSKASDYLILINQPSGASVVINGGTFKKFMMMHGNPNRPVNDLTNVTIKGGTFGVSPMCYGTVDTENYNIVDTDGIHSVKYKWVAQIGETKYETLESAVAAANAEANCDTIEILQDVTLETVVSDEKSAIVITNPVVIKSGIDGVKPTVSVENARAIFRVKSDATFENLNLVSTYNGGRCIETRVAGITVNINNCDLTATTGSSTQPLTIGGPGKGADGNTASDIIVNLNKVNIDARHYGIIIFNPVKLTITNSEISGYAALYFKGQKGGLVKDDEGTLENPNYESNNCLGSAGSVVDIKDDSTLSSLNSASGDTDNFSTVVFEDTNIEITFTSSNVAKATTTGDADQGIFGFATLIAHDFDGDNEYEYVPRNDGKAQSGNTITINSGSFLSLEGDNAHFTMSELQNDIVIYEGVTSDFSIDSKYFADNLVCLGPDADGKYTVVAKDYTITPSVTKVGFDSVKVGYTQPEPQIVTITNDGNVPVTIEASISGNYDISVDKTVLSADGADEKATLTIKPIAGLAVGNYEDKLTITVKEDGKSYSIPVSFLVYQPSSGGSSKPVEEPEEPVVEPEVPTEEPEAGEATVETEVTDGGEVELETPTTGGSAAADEDEAKITGVVLPTGTDSEVTFVPVSEQAAPAGKETQTKKVFEINVPAYEKGKAAVIKFTMTVAELAADGKEAADVALWHFDEETGEWTKLVTSYTIVDGVVYFEAITNDFSPFAIVYEDEPVDEPVDEPETPASPAPVLGLIAALGAAVVLRRK